MAYGKIFESLYTGSMVGAGLNVFAVWAYIIANAKPPGTIELNPKIMAVTFGCTDGEVRDAIEKLCAPDPESRSPENEGRRLLKEGQFLYSIPTWLKYNQIKNEIERRQQNREAQRRWRERKKGSMSALRKRESAESAHADGDGDVAPDQDQNIQKKTGLVPDSGERPGGLDGLVGLDGSKTVVAALLRIGFGNGNKKQFADVIEFAKQLAERHDGEDIQRLIKEASAGKNPAGLLRTWLKRGDTEKILGRRRA